MLSYVGSIDTGAAGNDLAADHEIVARRVVVRRLVEEGYQRVEVELPALLTVVKEIANPRLPTLRGKKYARQTPLTILGAADLNADPTRLGLKGSPTKVSKIFYPKVTRSGTMVQARDEEEVEAAVDSLVSFLESRDLLGGLEA